MLQQRLPESARGAYDHVLRLREERQFCTECCRELKAAHPPLYAAVLAAVFDDRTAARRMWHDALDPVAAKTVVAFFTNAVSRVYSTETALALVLTPDVVWRLLQPEPGFCGPNLQLVGAGKTTDAAHVFALLRASRSLTWLNPSGPLTERNRREVIGLVVRRLCDFEGGTIGDETRTQHPSRCAARHRSPASVASRLRAGAVTGERRTCAAASVRALPAATAAAGKAAAVEWRAEQEASGARFEELTPEQQMFTRVADCEHGGEPRTHPQHAAP
jgi:hypothetical protein